MREFIRTLECPRYVVDLYEVDDESNHLSLVYDAIAEQLLDMPAFRYLGHGRFREFMDKVVPDIMSESRIVLATSQEMSRQIFGFVVAGMAGSFPVLHMCYVRYDFRRRGLGNALMMEVFGDRFRSEQILYTLPCKQNKYFDKRWNLHPAQWALFLIRRGME